jgi:hypothetical protein
VGAHAPYHAGEHASERPQVEAVVIQRKIHQQLGPLEVPRRHAHIVLLPRMVELGQTPVNQPQLQEREREREREREERLGTGPQTA